MAKTKQGKTTKGSRQPRPKFLGIKVFGGGHVRPGNIIVRQRGTRFHPGEGVKMGKDFTIFAVKEGIVKFRKKFNRTFIDIQ